MPGSSQKVVKVTGVARAGRSMTILARRRRRRAPGARRVGAGGRAGAPRAARPPGREPRRADAGRPRGATREGPRRPRAAQVRGSNKLVLEEADRSLHDALCVVRSLVKEKFLVAGGGSAEVEASLGLADAAAREPGPVGFCLRAFADALEVVPYTLAENAGLNPIDVVTSLPGQHKRATFPTSKAPFSAVFHSFRLIFGRAIISRNGLEA